MLEYVFFHAQTCEAFAGFCRAQGLAPQVAEQDETWEVRLAEDSVDDDLADRLEAEYDQCMAESQRLLAEELPDDAGDYDAAGVVVNLKDGKAVYADVPAELLGRVMQVLTPAELNDLVNAIVDAVENPDERTFCQRMRDEAGD